MCQHEHLTRLREAQGTSKGAITLYWLVSIYKTYGNNSGYEASLVLKFRAQGPYPTNLS